MDLDHPQSAGPLDLSPTLFLIKGALLVVVVILAAARTASALFVEPDLEFVFGYVLSAVVALPIGGLAVGAVLWLLGAVLFGTTSRGAGRSLVMLGLCIMGVFLAISQLSQTSLPWYAAASKPAPYLWLVWAYGLWFALPWTKFPT